MMNGGLSHSPLSLFIGMHGWIDNWEKRDGLGALHGWKGGIKNLHAKESVLGR